MFNFYREALLKKFTRAYLFQIALEIMWLPLQVARALRVRVILLVFKKNVLVLIYSKLHSKSCDYQYEV